MYESDNAFEDKKGLTTLTNCQPFGQKRRYVDFPDYFSISKLPYCASTSISSALSALL